MSEPTRTRATDPAGPTITSPGSAPTAETDAVPPAPPGYELHTLIGSGGMGAVYRAHDATLLRDVAIKFLHARYAPDSVTAWRFTEEARITARLQHPGIPPIHQVGQTPDGRPFLAMKLIKGKTLDDLLKARKSPAEGRGRFVGIFEQVAQAVGFAHSRRIIHRDLKPANVMVGDFGEVQVMDWGLAKELGENKPVEPGRSDETLSVELRAGREGMEATQAGSLLGTPAYMAPEQAVGAIDQVNERADVFGLGAILCVILTGKPPFVADIAESARVLAARGKLDDAFARLESCGAEPELVALAKRCLAPEAAERPAGAGEVANAVAGFRIDAERRARQAEMDLARAEVKAAEVRKRRRVQRALAATVLGFAAVATAGAWWLYTERQARRHERQAEELRRDLAARDREAEDRSRRLQIEGGVTAALNEVQVLREEGWKQADDTHRWGLTLTAARSALKRAEDLLRATDPFQNLLLAELWVRVAAKQEDLARDERDRALLAEVDRIGDQNEIRLLFPISFTSVTASKYAAAFRKAGLDLTEMITEEAVAWLRAHRFRDRLVIAVRAWRFSLPYTETLGTPVYGQPPPAMVAAVGGPAAVAMMLRPSRGAKLTAILTALTDDPFVRQWWDAVEKKDLATLMRLMQQPEIRRMTSRELASLAEGLNPLAGMGRGLRPLLDIAYERFPGEFWVHFRLAFDPVFRGRGKPEEDPDASFRHLTAALAIRPNSAIARSALGMELLEKKKESAAGRRWLQSAVAADPTSPWPHIFLGMEAMDKQDWPEAFREIREAVRADPDTTFFMFSATAMFLLGERRGGSGGPSDEGFARELRELIAVKPDHPGGYQILGQFLFKTGDHRGALAALRKARELQTPDSPPQIPSDWDFQTLEAEAVWEAKFPAVLRGELKPADADELRSLTGYCANFEKKYALAARLAANALSADPKLRDNTANLIQFAGYSARAATEADTGLERARLRRQALDWLRHARSETRKELLSITAFQLWTNHDLAPVRDPEALAKLPPEERIAWEKFWKDIPNPFQSAPKVETAPAPRASKP